MVLLHSVGNSEVRYEPRAWGKAGIKFILERARVALWATPGVGKTGISYASLMLLRRKKLIKGALVVAPLSVVYNVWPRERAKWDQFQELSLRILHGNAKHRYDCLHEMEKADVYLINYEGLPTLVKYMNDNNLWRDDKKPFDMLVLDESSKTKNPSSQRFKLLKNMAPHFRRVLELTGSPAPNGLQDIWSQLYLLDDGAALGRYKTHFHTQYFNGVGFGGYELVLKPGADELIYERIKPLVLRMDAADFLDMPELVINDMKVKLDDAILKQYKKLENDLLLQLEDTKITPTNAAAAVNKCIQFTGGACYGDDGETIHEVHTSKMDALDDLVDELSGQPLLVFYAFRHEAVRLRGRYKGEGYAFVEGGMPAAETRRILSQWGDGKLKVLFAQLQVVSHGLNLQEGGAHNACFYTLPWDLEAYEQGIARLYRQGQSNTVFIHRLICPSTIDVQIARALKNKDVTQQKLLEAMKGEKDESA